MTAETHCAGCGVSLGKAGGPLMPFAAVPRTTMSSTAARRHGTFSVVGADDGGGGGGRVPCDAEYDLICYKCHLSQEQSAGLFDEEDDDPGEEEVVVEEEEEVMKGEVEQGGAERDGKKVDGDGGGGGVTQGLRYGQTVSGNGGGSLHATHPHAAPSHPPIALGGGLMELEGLFDDDEDDFEL
jgi:hypothetical protein